MEADACSGDGVHREVTQMRWVVTKFKENIKICADTSNQKNKKALTNERIEGMQKEQTRLMVPFQIPDKAKDKSGADGGGCCHADAECGGLILQYICS